MRIIAITDDHLWLDRVAVELSKERKCAIMPITLNPHPMGEVSDIPSIPELQAELLSAAACFQAYDSYSAMRHLELAAQRLDDARWRLAVKSNRWVQRDAVTMWGGEHKYWAVRRAMQSLKWACRHLLPSTGKELELHPTVFPVRPVDHRVGEGTRR